MQSKNRKQPGKKKMKVEITKEQYDKLMADRAEKSRIKEEQECPTCHGEGHFYEHNYTYPDFFGGCSSYGFGSSYCDCVAGSRRKMQETVAM